MPFCASVTSRTWDVSDAMTKHLVLKASISDYDKGERLGVHRQHLQRGGSRDKGGGCELKPAPVGPFGELIKNNRFPSSSWRRRLTRESARVKT